MAKLSKLEGIKPEHIVLRKWHEGNSCYEECTLRELWENGFFNGQSLQAHNNHLVTDKYINQNGLYVNPEFFDDVWKAFWSDLTDVEVCTIEA